MHAAEPRRHMQPGRGWKLLEATGAGPFISRIIHRLPDGSLHVWTSRRHRKGHGLGGWVSALFMIGSACFALGSLASLEPGWFGPTFQNETVVGSVFFLGSIFFTSAAFLQLLEAANADRNTALARGSSSVEPFRWFAWMPHRIGWLSAFIQFAGTLLFNLNTLAALLPIDGWMRQDLVVWTPNIVGCVCFLAASELAVFEECHSYFCNNPRSISWWIVQINLLGSIAFMVSGIGAVVPPGAAQVLAPAASNLWTFIGALCFALGAYLLIPEMPRLAARQTQKRV